MFFPNYQHGSRIVFSTSCSGFNARSCLVCRNPAEQCLPRQEAGSSMSGLPSLTHSFLPTVGGVGSSSTFVGALSGGAMLTPAPLNMIGVPNVVMLPVMAGALFYSADVRSGQVPCDSLPNRILPVSSFSSNNLGIADHRAAALSSAHGIDALSSSNIGIAHLRAGFAHGSTHHQQLPMPPPVKHSSTVLTSCNQHFNLPKLATLCSTLMENKPWVHQCNVHETESKKRQDTTQAQHRPNQKSLIEHHVSKATGKPRKRNLDPCAVRLLQVLILLSDSTYVHEPAACSDF